jgi:hypothetical protein
MSDDGAEAIRQFLAAWAMAAALLTVDSDD